MAGLIYHWKHGWIPLDHYAALSKAHGRESGAKLLMGRLGITGEDGKSHHLEQHLQSHHSVASPNYAKHGGAGTSQSDTPAGYQIREASAAHGVPVTQLKQGNHQVGSVTHYDNGTFRASGSGPGGQGVNLGTHPTRKAALAAIAAHDSAAANPVGKDFRTMTPAQKLRAVEIMYGTHSPQYKTAQRRLGGKP